MFVLSVVSLNGRLRVMKPKYIISCYEEGKQVWYGAYMEGYVEDKSQAYRYTEEEILENLDEHPYWLIDCRVTQTYEGV